MNERSEWCELCNAPRPRAPQVARSAAEGRGNRGSPSFAYFSWAIARKVCRPRGRDPAPLNKPRASGNISRFCGEVGRSCGQLCRSCGGQHRSRGEVPGMRPAAQSLSLASPRESNQREGDPSPPVPPLRSGQPAVLGPWVHCTTRTVRCAHSPRTSAMSQFTKREMLRAHPWPCAPRRGHRGGDRVRGRTGHRCARPGVGRHLAAPRALGLQMGKGLGQVGAGQQPQKQSTNVITAPTASAPDYPDDET